MKRFVYISIPFFFFRQSISLGFTDFTEDNVTELIDDLGNQFPGIAYHLVKK